MTYNKEFKIKHEFIDTKKIKTVNINTLNKQSLLSEIKEKLIKLENK